MDLKNLHFKCLEKLRSALPQRIISLHSPLLLDTKLKPQRLQLPQYFISWEQKFPHESSWTGAGEPPETVSRGSEDPSIVPVSTTDILWAWTNPSFLLLSSIQTVIWWSLTIRLYSEHLPEQGCDFDLNTMVTEMMFCRGGGPHTSAIPYSKPAQAFKNDLSPGYHKQGQMMSLRWNKQQPKLGQSLEQNCNIT